MFGKLGVHAATMWPNASNIWTYNTPNHCNNDGGCSTDHAYQCALLAIDVYRNFDGQGGKFGDIAAATAVADAQFTSPATQNERVTAYASTDAGNPNRMVVVAINKTLASSLNAGLKVTHTVRFNTASVYRVTGSNGGAGGCSSTRLSDVPIAQTNAFTATLPAQSISVFVLKP